MSSSTRMKPLAVAILAALGSGAAQSEQTLPQVTVQSQAERADGPVEGYRATRSATFTKTDTPLKEVPASVSVVPAEIMKDQAMQSLADVFRYVPGATAHQAEGNRDQVVLRGISTSADFYVDGVRDDAQVFRDLYNLERVEVLKGPGGMLFGRGGAGGVVNRVTRKPVFAPVGEASVTLGQYSQLRGTVDIGNKVGDAAAWRLNAMGETSGSYRDGSDLKRYAVNPTITLAPGASTVITLGFDSQHDERTADRGVPSQNGKPFDAEPSTFFGNPDQSKARSSFDSFYAIFEQDLGNGAQLKNTFRATRYDKFYQNVYPDNTGRGVNSSARFNLAAYNNANIRNNVFDQTDLTTKFKTGSLEHTLLTGFEFGHQNSTSKRNTGFFGPLASNKLASVAVNSPTATVTRFEQSANDADSNVKADVAALYVQDQITLAKDWKLLAGLRYDYFKADLDDRRAVRANNTRVENQTISPRDLARTDKEWSPRLGLIWEPSAAQTYYASYSYSFLPSAETLGLSVLSATTGVTTADLPPEESKNVEIGARWDLMPKLTLSAAAFRIERNNVRTQIGSTGFYEMTGQQRTDGVELGLQGEIARNWQVYAGYAWLDGRITKGATNVGNRPQLEPVHSVSLWNRFDLGGGWGAGLGIVHQGDSFTNADNTVRLPAFTRTDGALYYTFTGGKTRVALNVENLTDRKYFPTADGNNNITVGAPRNARLTLSSAF